LFIPVFCVNLSGGNTFLEVEGVLITTWVVSLIITIITSYNFLSSVMNECRARNLSGYLFGVQIGAVIKMIGESIYAMPSFVFPVKSTIDFGDGTTMYYWFIAHGYSGNLQYFIAFLMLFGSFCVVMWILKCHNIFCDACNV